MKYSAITFGLLCLPCSILADSQLPLTEAEQQFIEAHGPIKLCSDPDWMPYEGIDQQGRHIGLFSDFHALWAEKIGAELQFVVTDSWPQSLEYIQAGRCDILSSAQDVADRRGFLAVTDPFIHYNFAIATQPGNEFIIDLSQVLDRQFVLIEGYASVDILRNAYPDIDITTVGSAQQGLRKVEKGKMYGYIDTVPSINYQMFRHGISHLKISGVLDQHYAMSVGVRRDLPELLAIYNKAIAATSEADRQRILSNWLSIQYEVVTDSRPLLWSLAVSLLLVILLTYRYWKVRGNNLRLRELNKKLHTLSIQDQLTGLLNRHGLHEAFASELARSTRSHHTFSLLMIDIDHFKLINDRFGHDAGDLIIANFAKLLTTMVRQHDVVGRWGGEEFMIICPETPLAGARQLAEDLRTNVHKQTFKPNGQITVSIGIAEYQPGESIEECIKRADKALYQAKHLGRNRCVEAEA
ncbi:diguanylate cyclase [Methylophaga lonarensis]|uniref:diguanylate cyclase n=1 Tax=Methylophaga lonarensis TaxID=999151 RepID=UPI003D2BE0DA